MSLDTDHWQWLPSEWQVTIRLPSRCQLALSSCFGGREEEVRRGNQNCSVHTGLGDTTYLAAEEMVEHTAALEVPDDDQASAVADEDLVGVTRVLLQCLHHLKHSPGAGLLWQPRQGGTMNP